MNEVNRPRDGESELNDPERSPRVVGHMECRQVEMPEIEAAANRMCGIVTGITIERTSEGGDSTYHVDVQAVEGLTPHHNTLAERAKIKASPPAFVANLELDDLTIPMTARYTYFRGMELVRTFISFGDEQLLGDEDHQGISDAVVAVMTERFHPICREIYFQIDGGEGRFQTMTLRGELP